MTGDQSTRAGTSPDVDLLEAVTHGGDLATATSQPTGYPHEVVEAAFAAGRGMLEPRFRGEGKPFGDEVEAPSSAPPLERLVAFMGRDPHWSGGPASS